MELFQEFRGGSKLNYLICYFNQFKDKSGKIISKCAEKACANT